MANLHVAMTLQQHGPLQQRDLLRFIHVEQPTMAALLKRMERDGLVARKPDPRDSRARLVTITSRASSALVRARDAMTEVVDQAMADVSEPDRASLMRTLQLVVRNLADDPSKLTGSTVND